MDTSSLKTSFPAAAMLLAAFAVSASAQTSPAQISPAQISSPAPSSAALPPAAPHKETLLLKFPVGQTLYYKLTEDTAGAYLEPHGRITPIKSRLEMRQHQTVTDQRETDTAGLIDIGVDSMTVVVDDKPLPSPNDPQAVQADRANLAVMAALAKLIVLKNGKIEAALVNPGIDAEEVLVGEDPAHMNVLSSIGELPKTPVQVGDKWKSVLFLGMAEEHSTADLSLAAWETKDAAVIAVIKQVIQGQFGTPASTLSGMKIGDPKIKGWLSGTRTVRLNVEAGFVESEDSLVYMTVLLTPKGNDGKFLAAPTRMWVKVTSQTTRSAAPAPSPAATPE